MTLKQKFENVDILFESQLLKLKYDENMDCADDCELIADDYAIEFVKFIETDKNVRYVGCVIENGEEKQYSYNRKYYTTKELLKLFKKEKGL